jgi:hypothetical protein
VFHQKFDNLESTLMAKGVSLLKGLANGDNLAIVCRSCGSRWLGLESLVDFLGALHDSDNSGRFCLTVL